MAGSVRVLWPWPGGVDSTAIGAPEGDWLIAVGLAVVAFVAVVVIGRYAQAIEAAEEHPDAEPPAAGDPSDTGEPSEAAAT
jgi:hypothetical protein